MQNIDENHENIRLAYSVDLVRIVRQVHLTAHHARGRYAPSRAASTCILASVGYYVNSTRASISTPCPAGRYSSVLASNTSLCEGACALGYACPQGSLTATAQNCGTQEQYCDGVTGNAAHPLINANFLTRCAVCLYAVIASLYRSSAVRSSRVVHSGCRRIRQSHIRIQSRCTASMPHRSCMLCGCATYMCCRHVR